MSELSNAPWSKDLETTFADPAIREQVDAFLRGNVQPHVTKLEQSSQDALALYNDLSNDETAAEAYVAVTQQLFGDELADKVLAALQAEEDAEAPEVEAPEAPEVEDEDAQMRAEWKANKQAELYRKALDGFKVEREIGEDFQEELFHPFVASTGGDLDAAYDKYTEYVGKFKELFGQAPPAPEAEPAPPTLGTAPASAPTQKQYNGSIKDAVNDMFAEIEAGPPPTVGSV